MQKKFVIIITFAFMFFAGACSKTETSDLELSAANEALLGENIGDSVSTAAEIVGDPADYADGLASDSVVASHALNFLIKKEKDPARKQQLLALKSAVDDTDCTPEAEGSTDADSDGIAASRVVTFSCSGVSFLGGTLSASGVLTIEDGDDNDARSDFTVDVDQFTYTLETDSSSVSFTIDANLDVTVDGADVTLAWNYNFTLTTVTSGTTHTLSIVYDFDLSLTSDDELTPFESGTMDLEGTVTATYDGAVGTLTLSTDGLTYSQTGCSSGTKPGITDGTLSIVAGNGASISGVFSESSGTCSYTSTFTEAS